MSPGYVRISIASVAQAEGNGGNTDPLLTFTSLVIGAEPVATNSYSGYIDDFAVFDVALTQADIQALAAGEPVLGIEVIPEPTTLLVWSLLATLGITLGWKRRRG